MNMMEICTFFLFCSVSVQTMYEAEDQLRNAIRQGRHDDMQEIIDRNRPFLNIDQHDRHYIAPLMLAVRTQSKKSVEILLAAGANVNLQDFPGGNTALHYAVSGIKDSAATFDNSLVEILLRAGANPTIRNYAQSCTPPGKTPDQYAINEDIKSNLLYWKECWPHMPLSEFIGK